MLSKVKQVTEDVTSQSQRSKLRKPKRNVVERSRPLPSAEEYENERLVEEMWAIKAIDHAEVYFNLITSVLPSTLKITPYDDEIYNTFRQDFPILQVDVLNDDILKSPLAKLEWRCFAEKFTKVEDYSLGSLMRANAYQKFVPENALFVIRIQFLAIEIARNREGINDEVYRKFRPPPKAITRNT